MLPCSICIDCSVKSPASRKSHISLGFRCARYVLVAGEFLSQMIERSFFTQRDLNSALEKILWPGRVIDSMAWATVGLGAGRLCGAPGGKRLTGWGRMGIVGNHGTDLGKFTRRPIIRRLFRRNLPGIWAVRQINSSVWNFFGNEWDRFECPRFVYM